MRIMNQNYCSESATVITSSNIDPVFPVSNMKHPFRSKRVRTALGVTTLAIVFDMVTTEPIDSCVLLWPKEDGIRLSNTATVRIQANATNVWTSPAVNQVVTIDNVYMVASHYFSADQNFRYWRVTIEDVGNPYNFLELGVCWLGKALAIDNAQNGFSFDLVDQSKRTTNDFGHVYADLYPQLSSVAFSYEYLPYTQVQSLENAFRRNGSSLPVMVVLDPFEAISNKNHFAVYGLFKNSFGIKHVNYNLLNTDGISVLELA